VESGLPSAGLAFYRVVVRLTYVTDVPDRRLHRKTLVCTAFTTGFDDVNATSLLLVQCEAPFTLEIINFEINFEIYVN